MAWVTTVATRLAIDHLRLARVRRETYVGPWLPEPLVVDASARPRRAGRAGRRGLAGAAGRAGAALAAGARGVRAARGLRLRLPADRGGARAQRGELPPARGAGARHVEAERTRFDADPEQGRALLERFLAAAEDGDLAALEALLTADVVLYGDGGGKAKAAPEPVARRRRGRRASWPRSPAPAARSATSSARLVVVNGQPGRVLRDERGVWDVLAIDVVEGRIGAVRIVRNPDKLRASSDPCHRGAGHAVKRP